MKLGMLMKWNDRFLTPSPRLAACCSIAWTVLWFFVGMIGFSGDRQFVPYALLMLGLAIIYGVRAWLISSPLMYVAFLLVQIIIIVAIGFVTLDNLFPVALLFALMGETLYLKGLSLISFVVLLGSFIGMIGLELVFVGEKYLFVFAMVSVLLSPLPLLLGAVFTFVRQARQQQAYQEHLHTLMLEQQQEYVLSHERQRMARDLHDTLAQGVAGIILQLEAAKPHLAVSDGEKVQQIMDRTLQRARATLQEARSVIADLRVVTSLQKRVNEKIEQFQHVTTISCEFTHQDLDCDDLRINEIVLYTLAEGLANIAQHAYASRVTVSIIQSNRALTLQIRDNGCGFDTRKAIPPGHYGLLGMRERIQLIGGQFSLKSTPGQGTCIQVQLPLAEVA